MSSLRIKILTSYGLSMGAMLIFVAIIIADLHYLQTHIIEGEAVDDLILASQEIRRNEKNLFLYKDNDNLVHLRQQLDATTAVLTKGKTVLGAIAGNKIPQQLEQLLTQYTKQLDEYADRIGTVHADKQERIRNTGNQLSILIRNIEQRQRGIITDTTEVVALTLILASLTVILLSLLSAMYMVRRVVRPMAQLENQLDQLAEGNVQSLSQPSNDKEMQSFVYHFNSMLEQLREQQTQIRRNERAAALGVLVSGVAHELNNPLSNISTSVQLLIEDDGSTREELQKQWLSHIDMETDRARRIVRRLLDSVRQPTHDMVHLGAAKLVQGAVLLIHRLLPQDVFLHIEDIEDGTLLVDRERMQQVFINLIKNATHAGAHNIWITGMETTWQDSKPINSNNLAGDTTGIGQFTHVMLIRVEDDGPGISPEHMPMLFDPFFTTQSGGEGTGLGLYLVEEIINEQSGCVAVDNRDEGGARFSIWLPLEHVSTTEQEKQ